MKMRYQYHLLLTITTYIISATQCFNLTKFHEQNNNIYIEVDNSDNIVKQINVET